MPSRRSVLVGLGGLVAGGGALIGTGAFTTVEAQRTVDINTSGDASAFLGLSPAEREDDRSDSTEDGNEYVSTPGTDGTISIDLDGTDGDASGLNQNAITTFRNLVEITNNGTQEITSITLNFTTVPDDITDNTSIEDTFDFTVSTTGSSGSPSDDDSDQVGNGGDILTGNNSVPANLSPGSTVEFGIVVDLINGGDGSNSLPDSTNGYTLTITAETDGTSTATPPGS